MISEGFLEMPSRPESLEPDYYFFERGSISSMEVQFCSCFWSMIGFDANAGRNLDVFERINGGSMEFWLGINGLHSRLNGVWMEFVSCFWSMTGFDGNAGINLDVFERINGDSMEF
jgi:hypothetical protein